MEGKTICLCQNGSRHKNENAKKAEKGKIREITQEMIKMKKKIEEEKKYNGPIQKLEFLAH